MRLPGPIGDEVRRELARFGPEAALGEIVAAWPEAVGATVAANAWPARVAGDGTLHVATSSSTWAFELTQLAATVAERLAAAAGEERPRPLRFAPGPLPEAPAPASPRTVPEVPPAFAREGERIAGAIADERLREAAARAAAASLAAAAGPPDDRSV